MYLFVTPKDSGFACRQWLTWNSISASGNWSTIGQMPNYSDTVWNLHYRGWHKAWSLIPTYPQIASEIVTFSQPEGSKDPQDLWLYRLTAHHCGARIPSPLATFHIWSVIGYQPFWELTNNALSSSVVLQLLSVRLNSCLPVRDVYLHRLWHVTLQCSPWRRTTGLCE